MNIKKLDKSEWAKADGTFLQGYLGPYSRTEIESKLGVPDFIDEDAGKVPIEWTRIINGEVVTLYCWKRSLPHPDQPIEWNVGGHSREALGLMRQALQGVCLAWVREVPQ